MRWKNEHISSLKTNNEREISGFDTIFVSLGKNNSFACEFVDFHNQLVNDPLGQYNIFTDVYPILVEYLLIAIKVERTCKSLLR